MYWVNGIIKNDISLNNRAVHFGDGFFTTAKLKNGKISFLALHINRLIFTAKKLMFNNFNIDLLHKEILQAAKHEMNGVIKVIVIRGNNISSFGPGYYCINNVEPIRIICVYPFPKNYMCWLNYGVRLKTSEIRLSRNSFLSGLKHLNRLEQVMISINLHTNKVSDEALVLDVDGNIIECCSSNIFWRCNNHIFTPSLLYSGVNGIMRSVVLQILSELGYFVQEVMVGLESLKDADEVFITNSLLPIASVNTVDNYFYKNKTLCHLLRSYILKKCD